MPTHTSMLHVRVDDQLKTEASKRLADVGLTVSDAVRMLLTRITKKRGLPVELTTDSETHDAWFRAKVREALANTDPAIPHREVMNDVQAVIDAKRRA